MNNWEKWCFLTIQFSFQLQLSSSCGHLIVTWPSWCLCWPVHDKEAVKREFKYLCQDYDNSMLLFLCCNYVCYWDEEHVVMGAWIFVIWCAELNDRNKMSWNSLHHQDFEHYEKKYIRSGALCQFWLFFPNNYQL